MEASPEVFSSIRTAGDVDEQRIVAQDDLKRLQFHRVREDHGDAHASTRGAGNISDAEQVICFLRLDHNVAVASQVIARGIIPWSRERLRRRVTSQESKVQDSDNVRKSD